MRPIHAARIALVLISGALLASPSASQHLGPERVIDSSPATGVFRRVAETGDLDGDGDLDIVCAVVGSDGDSVGWCENTDGLGTFGPRQVLSTTTDAAAAVWAADIDGDHDTDVIAAVDHLGVPSIVVYENSANLFFGSAHPLVTLTHVAGSLGGLRTADIDRDGDQDLLRWWNGVSWHENLDGQGTFGPARVVTSDNHYNLFDCVDVADMDGDGDPDVLTASPQTRLAWHENVDGLGTFGVSHELPGGTTDHWDVADAFDFNGDGNPDVITSGNFGVRYYSNQGQGSFPEYSYLDIAPYPDVWEHMYGVEAADLDRDGEFGALTAGHDIGELLWFEDLTGPKHLLGKQVATDLRLVDLDGDEDDDVLLSSLGKLSWFENTAGFGHRRIVDDAIVNPSCVVAADLDGDGDRDLLVSSSSQDRIGWYENLDGAGAFGAMRVLSTAADTPSDLYAADLDGDGDLDVISASFSDDKVAWYENADGLGTFGPQQVLAQWTTLDPDEVAAADLDGDLDLDVVSVSRGDDKLAWFENLDGLGTFGPLQVISTANDFPVSLQPADMDGDGDLDLLVASTSDGEIAWYETLGAGAFGPQRMVSDLASGVRQAVAADLDGDGDLDVAAALGSQHRLVWYEHLDGAGTFGTQQVLDLLLEVHGVQAVDVDGDADLDLAAASGPLLDTLAWYENTDGLGTFGPRTLVSTIADSPGAVVLADLDGDWYPEFVSSEGGVPDKVTWYPNIWHHLDPWEDVGPGTIGVQGVPRLTMLGPLTAGSTFTLHMVDAAPLAFAYLFISVASTPVPFKGGTLYAFPYALLVAVPTDAQGGLHFGATFPGGAVSGQGLWFQLGIRDLSVPYGASLTNGVEGTVP